MSNNSANAEKDRVQRLIAKEGGVIARLISTLCYTYRPLCTGLLTRQPSEPNLDHHTVSGGSWPTGDSRTPNMAESAN